MPTITTRKIRWIATPLFVCVFVVGSIKQISASTYGSGNYSTGNFNVGSTPTPAPSNSSSNNSDNSSSSNSDSNSGSGEAKCGDQKPSSVPDLFQITAKKNEVILYFSPANNPRDRYFISYGNDPENLQYGFEFQNNQDGVVSVDVKSLQKNTTYYFKVRAGNGCQPGDWSNTMSVKTGQTKTFYKFSGVAKIITSSIKKAVTSKKGTNTGLAIPIPDSMVKMPANNPQSTPKTQNAPTSIPESKPAATLPATPNKTPTLIDSVGAFFSNLWKKK